MDIRPYIQTDGELETLAHADTVPLGALVIRALAVEKERLRALYERSPKLGTEVIANDIRYQLGQVAQCDFVARLIAEATAEQAKRRQKGEDRP